ncbi:PREDICTED: uncharacterized protein LOC105571228 [Vollenhovia emeryi]|uniref:uncharacterized protein LOC105571228 n=1 Tax=Vollenhovia emeryi TaxID=411798 RepID=UPI0005F39D0C|nr:PREDICTED: uncharacterized protein LOC105571228 [Vollenhovia emeryi]
MTDNKEWRAKRAAIKGTVTRALTFFESPGKKSVVDAKIRLAKLEECWKNFEEIQLKIESKHTEDDEEDEVFKQQVAEGEAERQTFEMNYFKAAGRAQEIIEQDLLEQRQQKPPVQQNPPVQEAGTTPKVVPQEPARQRPKLPEIKLPEFSGEFTQWMFFKDSFETTIHQEKQLTAMQKQQYLVGVLKGEALSVIQGYKISNENYEHAWKLLKDTYDNNIIIIESHLEELLNFPAITKENKADSIRQFVWHIRTHMTSLKALGLPVDQWETVLMHLAKKK